MNVSVNIHIEFYDRFKEFRQAPESLTPSIDGLSSYQKDLSEKPRNDKE